MLCLLSTGTYVLHNWSRSSYSPSPVFAHPSWLFLLVVPRSLYFCATLSHSNMAPALAGREGMAHVCCSFFLLQTPQGCIARLLCSFSWLMTALSFHLLLFYRAVIVKFHIGRQREDRKRLGLILPDVLSLSARAVNHLCWVSAPSFLHAVHSQWYLPWVFWLRHQN